MNRSCSVLFVLTRTTTTDLHRIPLKLRQSQRIHLQLQLQRRRNLLHSQRHPSLPARYLRRERRRRKLIHSQFLPRVLPIAVAVRLPLPNLLASQRSGVDPKPIRRRNNSSKALAV
jgi:hypothetical protein